MPSELPTSTVPKCLLHNALHSSSSKNFCTFGLTARSPSTTPGSMPSGKLQALDARSLMASPPANQPHALLFVPRAAAQTSVSGPHRAATMRKTCSLSSGKGTLFSTLETKMALNGTPDRTADRKPRAEARPRSRLTALFSAGYGSNVVTRMPASRSIRASSPWPEPKSSTLSPQAAVHFAMNFSSRRTSESRLWRYTGRTKAVPR